MSDLKSLYRRPLQAIALLTRYPVRVKWEDDLRWGGITGCFPIAGYAVGAASLLAAWAWLRFAPGFGNAPWTYANVAAALLLAIGAWTTGALHLDGWADFCDGCFAAASPEKRLAMMTDPRLGGFGATGLGILLLLKFSALSSILATSDLSGTGAPATLLAAPVAARWATTLALSIRAFPLANPEGMAAKARDGITLAQPILATLLAAPLFALSWRIALAAALSSAVATLALILFAKRQLGGINGDVLGAAIELSETTALMVAPC